MKQAAKEFIKKLVFRYTRFGAPNYPYNIDPIQLAALVNELERLRDTPGTIVEIGVARGMTTRFLCEHLVRSGHTGQRVCAIDTFASFNESDVRYEVQQRGKRRDELRAFAYNDYEVWKRNFRQYPFVTAYKADCASFDYAQLAPIKLVLLDVDLYLPTKRALEKIFPLLTADGVILVDDVRTNSNWDGAGQAYREFCQERGLPPELIGSRCGRIARR